MSEKVQGIEQLTNELAATRKEVAHLTSLLCVAHFGLKLVRDGLDPRKGTMAISEAVAKLDATLRESRFSDEWRDA